MILFKDDWLKYPTAIADLKTTNKSFLVLVETYRRMGVENFLFPLALMQPCLQGVDPFADDLTLEQKTLITNEAQWNPWYYLREICRVPQQGVDVPSKYLANRANIAMMWSFLNHFDFANILPRQGGKSVGADCLNDWILHIAGYNTTVQLYTHSRTLRNVNVGRLKSIRDTHPDYLNFYQEGVDRDNMEVLTCKALKNNYLTAVSQPDPVAAHKLGRGLTSAIVQSDEGPFCHKIHITFPVMMGSTGTARDIAEANGTFYGNIMTTTAGDRLSKEGEYCYKLIHDGMFWNEKLLDCADVIEARKMVVAQSRNKHVLMINGTFSAMQIGKSREWLRGKIAQARGSNDDARRDYLNEWTSGSDASPLPPEIQEAVRLAIREITYTEATKDLYLLRWYIPKSEILNRMNSSYFAFGLDTANMAGSDANGLVLTDLATMEPIAASDINEGSLMTYGIWIANMLIAYPRTTLVIEYKSSAPGILDAIAAKLLSVGINPFKRIFNKVFDEREKHAVMSNAVLVDSNVTEHLYTTCKNTFGFNTSAGTRGLLYGQVLQESLSASGHCIYDKALSEQLRDLIYKNGRIDHPSDGHDDLVIGYLLTQWFSMYARNIELYGIPRGVCRSMVSANGATMSKAEIKERSERETVLTRIAAMKERVETERSEFLKGALELQLARLVRMLPETDQYKVMQDLVDAAAETKKKATSLTDALKKHKDKTSNGGWYR